MESFYGGRSGAAFVIVQHFDGINIPQPGDGTGSATDYTYTRNLYAVDSLTNDFIIQHTPGDGTIPAGVYDATLGKYVASSTDFLVTQTADNINTAGWGWRAQENNGDPITGSTGLIFLEELARGMVQCFAQGAKSSSIVNYGEYVIIDTIKNMHQKNNPDNGKVFRRGMDVQAELAGAEYIGQIVGPQGVIAELDLDTYNNVLKESNVKTGEYTSTELVEGYDYDGNWNDNIKFAWANIKNEFGEIEKYLIGFTFPYLVLEYETSAVKPYDDNGVYGDMTAVRRIDDKSHPFYEKWHFDIPKGVKGDLIDNLRVVYYDVPAGTKYKYSTNEGLLPVKARLAHKFYEYYDDSLNREQWVDVYLWDEATQTYKPSGKSYEYKVQLKNAVAGLAYTETNFDNLEAGEQEHIYLGEYNIIEDVILKDDGTVVVQYSHDKDKIFDQAIQWVDKIELGSDGHFQVTYNTYEYDAEGQKTTTHNTYQTSLKWVDGVSLDNNGILTFTYSNDPTNPYIYKSIRWVDAIDQEQDGTITVTYNTLVDPDDPTSAHEKKVFNYAMKYIESVTLLPNGEFKVIFNTQHEDLDNPGTFVNDEYVTNLLWVKTMDLTQDGTLTTTMNDGTVTTKTLQWIDHMSVSADGTVNYYYNNNPHRIPSDDIPNFTQSKLIQWVDGVKLDGNDGLGSQKISIQYNTDNSSWTEIGDALNYIMEATVSKSVNLAGAPAPYHLLVLYSDPDRRAAIPASERTTYYSKYKKSQGQSPNPDGTYTRDDWHDLGNVRGAKGGFNTICETPNGLTDLVDYNGKAIQHEYILYAINERKAGRKYVYNSAVGRNEYYSGWGTVKTTTTPAGQIESEFFFYDYDLDHWFSIGGVSSNTVSPNEIVDIDIENPIGTSLKEDGILFIIEPKKMAN